MSDQTEETFQIVMEKVAEENQADAAMFLSGCFSLPLASTRSIAASAPIALLTDLERAQADAIVAELQPSLPEGAGLRVSPSGDTNIARLQWPRPPRIYGRDVEDFAAAEEPHDIKCPICGGMLRITRNGEAVRAATPAERARSDTIFRPAPVPANDKDPLFSGVKPLASANANYASIRSLQAGDTGFWMDNKGVFAPPPPSRDPAASSVPGETSHSKRTRSSAGLAAFMKPGVFAIVVGRTRDAQVVKMIAEIMGIPDAEARDKCLNLALTVARDISLDEAQSLLARLRNLGARARIVRPA